MSGLVAGPSAKADQLDVYLRERMREMRLPGLALAVIRDGQPTVYRNYGFADLESKTPVTEKTVFEIGSLSKQFTAAIVMMLVEEGRVGLDDEIAKFLAGVPEAWSGITVRHLLTHSSGLQEYLSIPGLFEETAGPGVSHEEVARLLFDRIQLEFRAGETWSYSNSGYLLLGNLIEQVTGQSYWDVLDERILKPLGMNASRSSRPSAVVANRARGYQWRDGAFQNQPALTENAYAAGAILSTTRDLAKWEAALAKGLLLAAASWERIWTPGTLVDGDAGPFDYGFGWFVDAYRGRRVLWHSGGTPGFSSLIHRYENDRLTVIVLTNHGDRVIDHMAADIAGFYTPALGKPAKTSGVAEEATAARLKEVLEGLLNGNPQLESLTPPMRLFLQTANGKGLWQWLSADGRIRSFECGEIEVAGDDQIVRCRTTLGDVNRRFSFSLTPEGRIRRIGWW